MTANIHVLHGMTWYGGDLNIESTSQNFVWAFSPTSPSGQNASNPLKQHVAVGSFSLDLTSAIGAGGVPIVVSPANWGWPTTVMAHAVMMGMVWVGALPAGAVIIRFLNERVKNPVFIHQILQLSSVGIVFIAFFVGVGMSLFETID